MGNELLTEKEKLLYRLRGMYRGFGYRPFRMSKFEKYELYAGNKDFLESAFTPAERMKIVPNRLTNPRNRKNYTQGGPNTMDRVHVPSPEEIERYMPEQQSRAGDGWWWLRSPGSNLFSAVAVYDDGSIYENGIHIDYDLGGVRPVIWVLLKV